LAGSPSKRNGVRREAHVLGEEMIEARERERESGLFQLALRSYAHGHPLGEHRFDRLRRPGDRPQFAAESVCALSLIARHPVGR
jgi:hypothetical protein